MLQPGVVATTVVCLTQVVTEDELRDDEVYEDIMEDYVTTVGIFFDFLLVRWCGKL